MKTHYGQNALQSALFCAQERTIPLALRVYIRGLGQTKLAFMVDAHTWDLIRAIETGVVTYQLQPHNLYRYFAKTLPCCCAPHLFWNKHYLLPLPSEQFVTCYVLNFENMNHGSDKLILQVPMHMPSAWGEGEGGGDSWGKISER